MLGPWHGAPPKAAGGAVPARKRRRMPTSQLRLQRLHGVQGLQPQATGGVGVGRDTAGVKPGQVVPGPQLLRGTINTPGDDLEGPASSMVPEDTPLRIPGRRGTWAGLRGAHHLTGHTGTAENPSGPQSGPARGALGTCPQGHTARTTASSAQKRNPREGLESKASRPASPSSFMR